MARANNGRSICSTVPLLPRARQRFHCIRFDTLPKIAAALVKPRSPSARGPGKDQCINRDTMAALPREQLRPIFGVQPSANAAAVRASTQGVIE
jgi:hypothetical protein